jgi:signal transduction histidine kinase
MSGSREDQAKILSLAVHEFRTPITVVAGYVRMLLRHFGGELGEQPRNLLQETEKSCGRLSALVAELNELANLEADQATCAREEVPIFQLLIEVAEQAGKGRDRPISVQVSEDEADAIVLGDPARLRQALDAVLAAALREHLEPGVVSVWGMVDSFGERGRSALVVIGDPAAAATNTFDRDRWGAFQEFRGGTGFSLPIARAVIERSGGAIWSMRESDVRTAVALTLPLKERAG